jgi:hypothetical protein
MIEQSAKRDIQCLGEFLDHYDRGVAGTALEIADVGPVKPYLECEGFLRQTAFGTQLAEIIPKALADIHAAQVAALSPNGLQTMSDILSFASYDAAWVRGSVRRDC